MRRYCRILFLLACVSCIAGCQKDTDNEPPMTVSQEMAVGVSEDIIPLEALEYSFLSYPVPEGFVAANDNTDVQAIYVSGTQGDASYICYTRQNNEELIDYMTMTPKDYEDAFAMSLETNVSVDQCSREEKDGWQQVDLVLSYEENGVVKKAWQNIYITDKYIFIMVYVQAGTADWESVFMENAANTVPKSLAESTQEKNE